MEINTPEDIDRDLALTFFKLRLYEHLKLDCFDVHPKEKHLISLIIEDIAIPVFNMTEIYNKPREDKVDEFFILDFLKKSQNIIVFLTESQKYTYEYAEINEFLHNYMIAHYHYDVYMTYKKTGSRFSTHEEAERYYNFSGTETLKIILNEIETYKDQPNFIPFYFIINSTDEVKKNMGIILLASRTSIAYLKYANKDLLKDAQLFLDVEEYYLNIETPEFYCQGASLKYADQSIRDVVKIPRPEYSNSNDGSVVEQLKYLVIEQNYNKLKSELIENPLTRTKRIDKI